MAVVNIKVNVNNYVILKFLFKLAKMDGLIRSRFKSVGGALAKWKSKALVTAFSYRQRGKKRPSLSGSNSPQFKLQRCHQLSVYVYQVKVCTPAGE